MLILTRKGGEALMIGDNVTVTILSVDVVHGKVRVGIDAPKDVTIMREEIIGKYQDIKDKAKDKIKDHGWGNR